MPAIAAIDNETLDHLLSVVDGARNLTGIRALSKRARRDHDKGRTPSAGARPLNASQAHAPGAFGRRISGGSTPGPPLGNRRSGLAGVSGLEGSSRLFLGLVGGAVAHQGHLVRCRLLARDGALFAAGALNDVVLGREGR